LVEKSEDLSNCNHNFGAKKKGGRKQYSIVLLLNSNQKWSSLKTNTF